MLVLLNGEYCTAISRYNILRLSFNFQLSPQFSDRNILLIDIWVNCCSQMGESPAHLSTSSFFHSSLKFLAEQKIFRAWSENEGKNDLQQKNNFFLSRPLWSGEREVIVVIITDYSPLHRPAPSAALDQLTFKRKLEMGSLAAWAPGSINTNFLSRTNFSELTGAHWAEWKPRNKNIFSPSTPVQLNQL